MNWPVAKITDVASVVSGGTPKSGVEEFWDGEVAWITPKDMGGKQGEIFVSNTDRTISQAGLDKSSAKLVPENSVILSTRAPIGHLVINTVPMAFNQGCRGLVPTKDVDVKYLYYFLHANVELLNNLGTGATFKELSKKALEDVEFPLPSVPEQKRIVAILDQAFADIDKARALTEQNLKNARELFESYLQQVFSQRGEGWNKYRMSDICEITSKLVDPREDQYLDLPHIGAGNMVSGTGELIEIKTAREEGLISGKFVFDDSMVLYSKIRPYLMKVCRPSYAGLCSADVYPLAPANGKLDKNYLYYLLLTKEFTDYAVLGSGRAGMPKVNRNHLFNFSTYLPQIDKQREYVETINEISDQARSLERLYIEKLHKLNELKSSLLQKAFTGELSKDNQEAVA